MASAASLLVSCPPHSALLDLLACPVLFPLSWHLWLRFGGQGELCRRRLGFDAGSPSSGARPTPSAPARLGEASPGASGNESGLRQQKSSSPKYPRPGRAGEREVAGGTTGPGLACWADFLKTLSGPCVATQQHPASDPRRPGRAFWSPHTDPAPRRAPTVVSARQSRGSPAGPDSASTRCPCVSPQPSRCGQPLQLTQMWVLKYACFCSSISNTGIQLRIPGIFP